MKWDGIEPGGRFRKGAEQIQDLKAKYNHTSKHYDVNGAGKVMGGQVTWF